MSDEMEVREQFPSNSRADEIEAEDHAEREKVREANIRANNQNGGL